MSLFSTTISTALFTFAMTHPSFAAGSHAGGHAHGPNIGQVGSDQIDRVIEVELGEMFFTPDALDITQGETVRFVIRNTGDFVHEFSIGTEEMHEAHEQEMMHLMDEGVLEVDRINHDVMSEGAMNHDDPNSVLLEPGHQVELVWEFSGNTEIELSCNVPGHRGGGMVAALHMLDQGS